MKRLLMAVAVSLLPTIGAAQQVKCDLVDDDGETRVRFVQDGDKAILMFNPDTVDAHVIRMWCVKNTCVNTDVWKEIKIGAGQILLSRADFQWDQVSKSLVAPSTWELSFYFHTSGVRIDEFTALNEDGLGCR